MTSPSSPASSPPTPPSPSATTIQVAAVIVAILAVMVIALADAVSESFNPDPFKSYGALIVAIAVGAGLPKLLR